MQVLLPQPHHLLFLSNTLSSTLLWSTLPPYPSLFFSLHTSPLQTTVMSYLSLPCSLRTGHQTSFTLKENLHLLSWCSCNISYWHTPGKLTPSCFHTRSNSSFGCCSPNWQTQAPPASAFLPNAGLQCVLPHQIGVGSLRPTTSISTTGLSHEQFLSGSWKERFFLLLYLYCLMTNLVHSRYSMNVFNNE